MKYFLTTAIDYVNSRPHLGTAYEKITADIIARYRRLAGYDTRFVMGNELLFFFRHGLIALAAQRDFVPRLFKLERFHA